MLINSIQNNNFYGVYNFTTVFLVFIIVGSYGSGVIIAKGLW